MKKLLTILILLLAVASQGWAEETTKLFPTLKIGDWETGADIPSWLIPWNANSGTIVVKFQEVEDGAQIRVQSKSESTDIFALAEIAGNAAYNSTDKTFTINFTSANAEKVRAGFRVDGQNYTISSIQLNAKNSNGDDVDPDEPNKELYNSYELYNWASVVIGKSAFADAAEGDIITATFEVKQPQVQFLYGDWSKIGEGQVINLDNQSTIELQLTQEIINSAKVKGLIVNGVNYKLGEVKIGNTTVNESGSSVIIGDWHESLSIDKSNFENVSADTKLTVAVSDYDLGRLFEYKDGSTISDITTSDDNKTVTLKVDATIKEKGLTIKGKNNKLTKVTLTPASTTSNYTLTVNHENGNVKVEKKNGENYEETSETTFAAGTELRIIASPIAGSDYYFSSWSSDPTSAITTDYNKATLTLNQNTIVTASFNNEHNNSKEVSINQFEAMSPAIYSGGELTPSEDAYEGIQEWIGDNSSVKASRLVVKTESASRLQITVAYTDGTEKFVSAPETAQSKYDIELTNTLYIQKIMIQTAVKEKVKFTSIALDPKYTLTINQPSTGGEIRINNTKAETGQYNEDATVTLTAVAATDYELEKWTDGTNALTAESDGSLKVTMDADKTVTAEFKLTDVTVGADETKLLDAVQSVSDWEKINIEPSKVSSAAKGDIITAYIAPTTEGGTEIDFQPSGGGTSFVSNDYSFDATTKTKTWTLTEEQATTIKSNGFCITGQKFILRQVTIKKGTSVDPNEKTVYSSTDGLKFDKEGSSGTVKEQAVVDAYIFSNASANDKITIYAQDIDASAKIALKGGGSLNNGSTNFNYSSLTSSYDVGFTEGKVVCTLSADGVANIKANGLYISAEAGKFTITKITLTTSGEIPAGSHTLTITNPTNGTVTASPVIKDNKYAAGTTVTLTATANSGYTFTKWTKGDSDAGTDETLEVTMDADKTITAVFEAQSSTLTKLNEGETRTVWTSANAGGDAISWTTEYSDTKNANWGGILEAGEIFKFYVASTTGDNRQIVLRDASSEQVNTINPDVVTEPTVVEMQLTAAMVEKLSSGFCFSGTGYTITKVELYKPAAVKPVFDENGKADLSKFVSDGTAGYSYADGKGTITTGEGQTYKGVILNLGEDDYVQGTKLIFKFQSETSAQIHANYVGAEWADGAQVSTTGTEIIAPLDATKQVNRIDIQLWNANTTAVLTEVSISNKCTLTVSAPATYGSVAVKKGETASTDTEFDYGTSLTLTATANEGYEFSKWLKNGEAAGTSATLTVTMDADVTIEAVFKGSKLNNEERRTLWESSTGEALTWSDMMVQPAEVGEIVEAGEILIVTVKSVDTSDKHYPQIQLRDKDGNQIGEINPLVAGENKLTITSEMATKMAGGFKFQGESATLTNLELYKPTPITKLAEKDSKTLWQNDGGETLSWNTIAIDRAAEWGSVLEEDERFIISVKAKESGDNIWPTIQLQDLDGQKLASTATLLNDVKVPGDIVITLTAEMVEKLKNGFSITGDKATITKAALYKPALPAKTVKILNDTETAITGDALVTVSAAKLANISAYDVLTVNFAINAETAKLVIKCNGEKDGWDYIKEMEFSGNETLFAIPLTESAVALLKANGLGITGSGYTFKSVTIKTAGEVADDEKEEDDIANADATEATKKVFGILKDLYGKKIVSGVVANVDWNTKEAENVYGWTGKYPAINVYDFINLHASKDVNSEGWLDYSDITTAKNWWQEGGLVGAMWHWQVKANNGTDYTCTPGTAAGETSFDASKVYVEGTSENTLAKQQLDQLCGYLKKMQDAGIPVVWRPLHEASGNVEQYSGGKAWFWWGAKGADVYKQLWQWMYNYMVNTKGLNNLIWVWTSQTKDHNWYPGDAYVDIIGRDNYGATAASLAEEYEAQKVAYPNKMITLSECGNSETTEMAKLSSIWDAGSRWSWFMTWYDGDYNDGKTTTHKHTSEAWWKDTVAKDYVVTRDQMKELLNQGSSDNPSQTGVNISLDDLNEGWSSSYNAATKTITTEGEWAARGWYIGDDRYSQKGSITVKYEAVEFGVTLKMEYTNASGESKSVSAGAAAGETEVELDIPTDVKTIEKVYITYQPVGTLKLTAATVNDRIADNRTEKTLVESEAKIADGDIEINRGLFGNAAAKDVIRIYATGLSDASKIALELADYSGTLEGAGWVAFTESPFELKLTENMLSSIKEKGLLVRGEAFTFTKAALYTESDLGSVITDGGSDGDGGSDSGSSSQSQEKPIFNKKDGEADLSQMSAQDESTTTVTYSKRDNTITITTTEPYKAAQIWLNTPEEVTGNVLAVEIAEPGVDVTITVGYTDGSESSMSSRVAASTRAMTRGSAGTTIMVPLEVGKQVQKVEVKNANAGTITLNSMVMTNQDVFTNGKANLSMLKPQSGATYDISTYTLATTKGWTGVTVTPLETETVEGEELVVRFVDDAKVKVAVKYRSDEDGPSTIMEESANVVRLTLDRSKAVQEIMIQPTEAAILVFKEIAVNWERDTSGMLIEGKTLEVWSGGESLSWNEIAHQKKDISAQLQEFDQILVTVSGKAAGNDWPKVFLRDASSEMVGKEELLNEVTSFPCVVKFVLTKDMAERLKGGFSICGDGVTVTKVEIYRPFAPKKGDIHLRALDYGYGSEYDAATNTITTTQRWAARGWEIGDSRYNNKDLVIVEFEAVDFPVTLKMEYVDAYGEKQATSAGVAAGNTEVCLAIPSGIRQMDKAYIIYQNPGSLKLTNAEVITALQAGSRGISEDSRGISISSRSGYRPDGSKATAGDDAWYSLSGQRIEKPTAKGVYIHNGKTVVVH